MCDDLNKNVCAKDDPLTAGLIKWVWEPGQKELRERIWNEHSGNPRAQARALTEAFYYANRYTNLSDPFIKAMREALD